MLDQVKKFFLKFLKIILAIHIVLIAVIFFLSVLYSFINPPFTSLMVYRSVFYHHKIKPVRYVSLKKIPNEVVRMVVMSEDNTFYKHMGVEISAMQEAYKKNRKLGYNMYGGSTIPQQLARSLFLFPKKWLIRKYIEIIIALEMDLFMSKKRIMELYLNYIEWGKGIYGIGSASYYYYGRAPSRLSKSEMVNLITILPNPLRYSPYDSGENKALKERFDMLMGRFIASTHSSADLSLPNNTNISQTNFIVDDSALSNTEMPTVTNLISNDLIYSGSNQYISNKTLDETIPDEEELR